MLSTIPSGGNHYLRFRLRTSNTSTLIGDDIAAGILSTGTWTHTVAVYDGTNMKLYKDGVEVGSLAKSGTIATSSSVDVAIGNQPDSTTGRRPWDGLIDEVMVFDRALSAEEVTFLYETTCDCP